jgi:hypothetical protein
MNATPGGSSSCSEGKKTGPCRGMLFISWAMMDGTFLTFTSPSALVQMHCLCGGFLDLA